MTIWQIRTRKLEAIDRPLLMGIVNVTPDSFSDGGQFLTRDRAVDHALELADQGADILDIGGESTRPYATPVSPAEELDRVIPVIESVRQKTNLPISIDTRKPKVAQAALEAGAEILNDVEGFRNQAMRKLAVEYQAGVCVMHMQGTPETMQDSPQYDDVVGEVRSYLKAERERLVQEGLPSDQICLDPGIGFGKQTRHNLELLRNIDQFVSLGGPILVGHSRKGFLGKLIGDPQSDRLAATIGISLAMALRRVSILRIHDVQATREALTTFLATKPWG